jgi:hypothetical protein
MDICQFVKAEESNTQDYFGALKSMRNVRFHAVLIIFRNEGLSETAFVLDFSTREAMLILFWGERRSCAVTHTAISTSASNRRETLKLSVRF